MNMLGRIITWPAATLDAIPAIELVASVDQETDIDNSEDGGVPWQ